MPFYTKKQSIRLLIDKLIRRRLVMGKCWRFNGAHDTSGYGITGFIGRVYSVHRLSAFISLNFDLASLDLICHKNNVCKFRDCWNPLHIYIGNESTNQQDRIKVGRHNFANITHCLNGHEFTKENTYVMSNKGRGCRKCRSKRQQEYIKRKTTIKQAKLGEFQ